MTRRELDGRVPLIGFAGAPFTLASYAIEGGPSRDFARTKALMYGHPEAWHRLCDRLAQVVSAFVVAQVEAGAQAIQIFDSWVGALSAEDYREFASPHTAKVFAALKATDVPTIHFGTGHVHDPARPRRGRRGRHRRRLAPADRRRLGPARRARTPSRATSTRRSCSARAIACSAPPRTSCSGRPGGPATSSTSVTASCLRRRSSTSRCSRGSCTGSAPTDEGSRGRRRRAHRRRRRRGRRRTRRPDAGARRPPPRADDAGARGRLAARRRHPFRARRRRAGRRRAGRHARAEAGRARALPRARTGRRDRLDRIAAHRVRAGQRPAARLPARHAARPAADARRGRGPDDALRRGARPRRP